MKHQLLIPIILLSIVNLTGCAETKSVSPRKRSGSDIKVAAETPTAPPRTPLPAHIRKDADGNLINPEGWPIQEIIPKEARNRPATGKTRTGRTVIFNIRSITPEGRPVSEAASPAEDYYEWRISDVRELSGQDGKIFCYEYSATLFGRNSNANGFASATNYRLCDYDGDGKYKFNGSGYRFTVPDWVKTLPGDPSAIDSNAKW